MKSLKITSRYVINYVSAQSIKKKKKINAIFRVSNYLTELTLLYCHYILLRVKDKGEKEKGKQNRHKHKERKRK
jgi:uncharacterized protein YutD